MVGRGDEKVAVLAISNSRHNTMDDNIELEMVAQCIHFYCEEVCVERNIDAKKSTDGSGTVRDVLFTINRK